MTTTKLKKLKLNTAFKFSPYGDLYIRSKYDFRKKLYLVFDYNLPICRCYCAGNTLVNVDPHFNDVLPF